KIKSLFAVSGDQSDVSVNFYFEISPLQGIMSSFAKRRVGGFAHFPPKRSDRICRKFHPRAPQLNDD
ncbi:MAG: hypothetical protein C4324_12320, partial [Blastocatellia bacterium]